MFKFLILATTLFVFANASAQKFEKVKRSDVTAADFESNASSIDTSADAIVLLDQGSTNFISNKANWFSNVYKRFVRIKVLKHPGVNAATHEIVLYKNDKDDEEVLSDVRGTTYNLENGKLVSTALDAGSIFEDQLNKHHTAKKFTLPAVKEGSIIDLSYTITSPFNFNLRSWFFQNTWYPTLESDFQVAIPGTLNYVMKKNGLDSFAATSKWETRESFMFNELNASTQVNYFHWNMKNIPALKIENYISAASNYADKLEFQLASTYNGESTRDIAGDWTKTADFLLQSPDFGEAITEQVNIPGLDNIIDPNADKLSKAKQIFYYIQSNFSCASHNYFFVQTNLQNVVKKARGNVGEINLLLINKLRQYNISVAPVIVSTRANGFAYTKYPMVSNFNYLVCKVYIDDHLYYLDASQPLLGFGKITTDCYNDIAVEIIKNPETVLLSADSLKETRQTTIFVFNADKGMEGTYVSNESDASSYEIREQLLTTSQQQFADHIKNDFVIPVKISDTEIDSLKQTEYPLAVKFNFTFDHGDDDIIYFNPLMIPVVGENYFKAENRLYPVELPYCTDETFTLNMEIPKGYVIDELPKSVRVNLNDADGSFEYLVGKTATNIQFKFRLKINKAYFAPEDYATLRDFYAFVVKKEAEQIVFKKQ